MKSLHRELVTRRLLADPGRKADPLSHRSAWRGGQTPSPQVPSRGLNDAGKLRRRPRGGASPLIRAFTGALRGLGSQLLLGFLPIASSVDSAPLVGHVRTLVSR